MPNAHIIQLPSPQEPICDPKTGIISRNWFYALTQISQRMVQGPLSPVTDGTPVLFDGTSGRLVKE